METIFTQDRGRKRLPVFDKERHVISPRLFAAFLLLLIWGINTSYAQAPVISYTSPLVYTFGVGTAQRSPTNTGGAATSYSISPALPFGLVFNNQSGTLGGYPLTMEMPATNFTVTATNGSGSGTAVINITVKLPAVPKISYGGPKVYPVGAAISSLSPVNTGGAIPSQTPVNLPGSGSYGRAMAIAIDSHESVYIADEQNNRVYELPAGGSSILTLGSGFSAPRGCGCRQCRKCLCYRRRQQSR